MFTLYSRSFGYLCFCCDLLFHKSVGFFFESLYSFTNLRSKTKIVLLPTKTIKTLLKENLKINNNLTVYYFSLFGFCAIFLAFSHLASCDP